MYREFQFYLVHTLHFSAYLFTYFLHESATPKHIIAVYLLFSANKSFVSFAHILTIYLTAIFDLSTMQ